MKISLLITDNGPHTAEKWADATATHIVDIADHVAGETRGAAVKLQAAVIDILLGRHTTVQTGERAKIAEVGHDRLTHDFDAGDHVDLDAVVAEIIAAAQGTPWAADFNVPEMPEHLRALLSNHFRTSMHIERSWHADRNPTEPQAVAFKALYHPGPTPADTTQPGA